VVVRIRDAGLSTKCDRDYADVRTPVQSGTAMRDETETRIRDLEEQLSTTADDAQLANIDLQNMLQKQQQTLQMFSQMSKMSKMMSDTAMAVLATSASSEHAGALH